MFDMPHLQFIDILNTLLKKVNEYLFTQFKKILKLLKI